MSPKKDINVKMSTKCNTNDLIMPKTTCVSGARVVYSNKNVNTKLLSNYSILKTIGKGNFAKVKLARHKLTKKKVAIKIVDKTRVSPENLIKLFREVKIMKTLDHPNIVKLYEVLQTETTLFLVMEYVSGGELFDYLVDNGKMKESLAREKFRQIVSAIQYCHSKGVVHRDLKAENLLLDELNNVKIVDFGFSNEFSPDSKLDTFCGSPPYAAPELFLGRSYVGPEVDVWSLGIILYTIVTGSLPFDGRTLKELKQNVLACHLRVPFYLTSECDILLRKMIVRDPKKRKTLEFIMKDKWINLNYDKGLHLRPFQCVNENYNDVDRINKMVKMGISHDLIVSTLEANEYNHVMATYLILSNERFESNFVNTMSESDELLWKMNRKFGLNSAELSIPKVPPKHATSLDVRCASSKSNAEVMSTSSDKLSANNSVAVSPSIPKKQESSNKNIFLLKFKNRGRSKTVTTSNRNQPKNINTPNDQCVQVTIEGAVNNVNSGDITANGNWTIADIPSNSANKLNLVITVDECNSHANHSIEVTAPTAIPTKTHNTHRNTIHGVIDDANRSKRNFSIFRNVRNPFKSLRNDGFDVIPSYDEADTKSKGMNDSTFNEDNSQIVDETYNSTLNHELLASAKPQRILLTANHRKVVTKNIVESFVQLSKLLISLNVKFKHRQPYKLMACVNWKDFIVALDNFKKQSNENHVPSSAHVAYSESDNFVLFEIEINRVIFNNFYTIRLKRLIGGSIYYKEVASNIVNLLDFVVAKKK